MLLLDQQDKKKGRATVLDVDVLRKKKKKTAAQITPNLLNNLQTGTNINLFVIQQKAILLLKFRDFQLGQKKLEKINQNAIVPKLFNI